MKDNQSKQLSLSFDSATSKHKQDKHKSQLHSLKQKLTNSIKEKILVNNNLTDFKIDSNNSVKLNDNKSLTLVKLNNKPDLKVKSIGLVSDYGQSDNSDEDSLVKI